MLRDKLDGTSNTGDVKAATFSGTHTFSSGNLLPSTYTPTLTNTSNVSSSTAAVCTYFRFGDIVMVNGTVDISAVAANVPVLLQMTLPIASNLGAYANLSGLSTCLGASPSAGVVRTPSDFSDVAELYYKSDTTAATYVHFNFSYRVI